MATAIINKCNRTKVCTGMGHEPDKNYEAKQERGIIFSFAQRINLVWNFK